MENRNLIPTFAYVKKNVFETNGIKVTHAKSQTFWLLGSASYISAFGFSVLKLGSKMGSYPQTDFLLSHS